MSGDSKRTLPTSSRFAIFMMRARERLTYAEISLRTGVSKELVRAICKRPGRMIDRHRAVTPALPPDLCGNLEALAKKIDKLHDVVCGEQTAMRLKVPMSGG